jgi:hypothetical protein
VGHSKKACGGKPTMMGNRRVGKQGQMWKVGRVSKERGGETRGNEGGKRAKQDLGREQINKGDQREARIQIEQH